MSFLPGRSGTAKIAQQVVAAVRHGDGVPPAASDALGLQRRQWLDGRVVDRQCRVAFPHAAGLHVLGLEPDQLEDGRLIVLALVHRREVPQGDDGTTAERRGRTVGKTGQLHVAFGHAAILDGYGRAEISVRYALDGLKAAGHVHLPRLMPLGFDCGL